MLFAEDMVVSSESPKGLQNMLDRLIEYCNEWNLSVNVFFLFTYLGLTLLLIFFFKSQLQLASQGRKYNCV